MSALTDASAAVPEKVAHGGDLGWLTARYPTAPRPLIDLSTGINPWPYPIGEIPDHAWTRLPQAADVAAAREALRRYLAQPDASSIALAPGSEAIIQRLPELFAPTKVVVVSPTYGSHAPAWRAAGHTVEELDGHEAAESDAAIIVVANPNNPTGTVVQPEGLRELAPELRARGGCLIIDEAYADIMPEISFSSEAPQNGAIVLRSLGKAFGLAGLRAGALVGPPEIAARLEAHFGAWPVSGLALVAMARAYPDATWMSEKRIELDHAARALDDTLREAGLEVVGGTVLYRLVESPVAPHVHDTLARHGIAVRLFDDNPRWLRFGIPADDDAHGRLAVALKEAMSQ